MCKGSTRLQAISVLILRSVWLTIWISDFQRTALLYNVVKYTRKKIRLLAWEKKDISRQEIRGGEKKTVTIAHKPQTIKIREQVPQPVFRKFISWIGLVGLGDTGRRTKKKEKKQVFHFSLASVVKITCTSTSLVNCAAFFSFCIDGFLENLIDECSHCKLLSKSTIWTCIQLGASRKGKRHLDWMSFQRAHNSWWTS